MLTVATRMAPPLREHVLSALPPQEVIVIRARSTFGEDETSADELDSIDENLKLKSQSQSGTTERATELRSDDRASTGSRSSATRNNSPPRPVKEEGRDFWRLAAMEVLNGDPPRKIPYDDDADVL